MDYKQISPSELKLDAAGEGSIELAFAQFGVRDLDGDVTLPGAFGTKEVPMSAYGHTSWDGALPVGKGVISEVGQWAVFKGQMFMDTTAGRDTHATLKGLGSLAQFSYGYDVKDSAPGTHEGQRVRFLKSLDTHEISGVLRGAGISTHLLAIKSGAPASDAPLADLLAWDTEAKTAILDRLASHAGTRGAEGRKLSRSDRAALEDFAEMLDEQLAMARRMLASPESMDPAKQAAFRQAEYENLLAMARANGVPLG